MQTRPKVGTAFDKQINVELAYSVDFSKDGIPPILATPWLIWFLESAAIDLMQPYLEPGELTVGVRVDVEHLSPTPAGETVTCAARVVHADGPIVSFQLEARDRHGAIARGLHKRRVVNARRFADLVRRKTS